MDATPQAPGRIRYHAVRLVLKVVCSAYVRTRVIGGQNIPGDAPYIICFNHPSWLDPIFFAAFWPDRRHDLYVFGPREQDMRQGTRNTIITWTRRGVPFQPHAQDVIDTTRRAVGVLRAGGCLAIAGEGRLSDHEGEILPLETGLAHFAQMAGVPILPAAIVGSRWISFGSRVTIRVGQAVEPGDYARGKGGARAMTDEVQSRLQRLLEGVQDREPPGWLGRTISEAFNDRPWLDEAPGEGESNGP